jgi:hypothetical protein
MTGGKIIARQVKGGAHRKNSACESCRKVSREKAFEARHTNTIF